MYDFSLLIQVRDFVISPYPVVTNFEMFAVDAFRVVLLHNNLIQGINALQVNR